MRKKPTLTLVDEMKTTSPASPATLAKTGSVLRQSIQREYKIDDAGGAEMLLQICVAADRADECAEIIQRDGPVITTRHGMKEHPLLKIELASRSFVVRSLHRLGLDIEPTRAGPGRPPGIFNHKR